MSKKRDVTLLVTIAILLGASGGILHGLKKQPRTSNDEEQEVTVTLTEALELLQPLLIARSFDTAAQSMQQFSDTVMVQVITALITGQGPEMPDTDKIHLILKTIALNESETVRSSLCALLQAYYAQKPVFYYAVVYDSADSITGIMKWAQDYTKNVSVWTMSSLQEAVVANKPELMDQLYAHGVRADAQVASQLLAYVVEHDGSVEFIPFLVRRLAANPNYSSDGKKTVLISAVEHKNLAMVKTLLQEGADPKLMLDTQVGTPVQNAYSRGYAKIERAIRDAIQK